MNQVVPIAALTSVPALIAAAGEPASLRFLEFFAANIRNPHTRRAYYRAAEEFLAWCANVRVPSVAAVQPVHVATWIEASTRELAAPSIKQRLAAVRQLFVTSGQTPVLDPAEARALLDSIDEMRGVNFASLLENHRLKEKPRPIWRGFSCPCSRVFLSRHSSPSKRLCSRGLP